MLAQSKNKRFVFWSSLQLILLMRVQRNFRTKFRKDHFHTDCVDPWVRQLETTWFVYKTNVSRPRTPEEAEETIIAAKIATNAHSTCSQYDRFLNLQ